MTQSNRSANAVGVLPGTRILCVDDESMIGELVAQILRSQLCCAVTTAKNGEEALVALERHDFDLILVDYVMPNMDGGELYRKLEEDYPEVLPRLMFITGDILFVGKVGGTDLGDGARREYDSLHNKLMTLPDHIEVWPGHDFGTAPSSTIGNERRTNPFLQQKSFEDFVHLKAHWIQYKREHGLK